MNSSSYLLNTSLILTLRFIVGKLNLRPGPKALTVAMMVLLGMTTHAQVFYDREIQSLVQKGVYHIYNASEDSALYHIEIVDKKLPQHPVVPLMRAMTLLWSNIPIITEDVFAKIKSDLSLAISRAEALDPRLENPEMIFFSMASYGLLAEYYADRNFHIQAVREAGRAYSLMKKGFDLTDAHPEFLLPTGLYNYFREKYPEKYPVYKPLMWFFRRGNAELGLKQLEKACELSVISKVEATIYLGYIYLKFEHQPEKGQKYLSTLVDSYPNNFYAKAKYLESLANPQDFKKAPVKMIYALIRHKEPYYKLAGHVFYGYFEEFINKNTKRAEFSYRRSLSYSMKVPDHGEYYKSLAYLRLGSILLDRKETKEAEEMLRKCVKHAETKQIKEKAQTLLRKI